MAATATREEIEGRVFEALEEFGAESDAIGPDAEVELAQIVEDEYGVQLKGEDMEGVKTVRQAVDLVMSKLG
jgi:acyl carrier protein